MERGKNNKKNHTYTLLLGQRVCKPPFFIAAVHSSANEGVSSSPLPRLWLTTCIGGSNHVYGTKVVNNSTVGDAGRAQSKIRDSFLFLGSGAVACELV